MFHTCRRCTSGEPASTGASLSGSGSIWGRAAAAAAARAAAAQPRAVAEQRKPEACYRACRTAAARPVDAGLCGTACVAGGYWIPSFQRRIRRWQQWPSTQQYSRFYGDAAAAAPSSGVRQVSLATRSRRHIPPAAGAAAAAVRPAAGGKLHIRRGSSTAAAAVGFAPPACRPCRSCGARAGPHVRFHPAGR